MMISVSGSTCVGKTTLINQLMKIPQFQDCSQASLEPAEANPFLYKENSIFQSQVFFYAEYLKKCVDYLHQPMPHKYYFLDRCIDEYELISDYRFKLGELTEEEHTLCLSLVRSIKKIAPPIDKTIYLYCSPCTILERQAIRDRHNYYSENTITLLNSMYHDWASKQPNILYVNTDQAINISEIIHFLTKP